jgi:hypothetical protein
MRPSIVYTVFVGLVAIIGFQAYQNYKTSYVAQIETKRSQINEDMTNELLWQKLNQVDANQMETARMQGYNEGINACAYKLDPKESQISSIWHSGYYRGLEQTEFVGEIQYEKGYSTGFQIGQRENMKAIQTIIKSGDNIQNALENFANKLQKQQEEALPAKQVEEPKK